jgi:hypothetical protein
MKDTAANEIYVNDYDQAKSVSGNSLRFINRRGAALVDAARKYIAAEDFNRRYCFGMITAETYWAWQAWASELDAYRARPTRDFTGLTSVKRLEKRLYQHRRAAL